MRIEQRLGLCGGKPSLQEQAGGSGHYVFKPGLADLQLGVLCQERVPERYLLVLHFLHK